MFLLLTSTVDFKSVFAFTLPLDDSEYEDVLVYEKLLLGEYPQEELLPDFSNDNCKLDVDVFNVVEVVVLLVLVVELETEAFLEALWT
jgi:hypothetical protein